MPGRLLGPEHAEKDQPVNLASCTVQLETARSARWVKGVVLEPSVADSTEPGTRLFPLTSAALAPYAQASA